MIIGINVAAALVCAACLIGTRAPFKPAPRRTPSLGWPSADKSRASLGPRCARECAFNGGARECALSRCMVASLRAPRTLLLVASTGPGDRALAPGSTAAVLENPSGQWGILSLMKRKNLNARAPSGPAAPPSRRRARRLARARAAPGGGDRTVGKKSAGPFAS